MNAEFQKNLNFIRKIFSDQEGPESKYMTIIGLGKRNTVSEPDIQIPENKINGCQSTTYIKSSYENGVMNFQAQSDALISSGLAALLILAYNNQPPEIVVNNPPEFINDLEIHTSLSINRANGFAQMYLKLKEDSEKHLLPPLQQTQKHITS